MSEVEQSVNDVPSVDSSPAPESASPQSNPESASNPGSEAVQSAELPFHEHPRWKEVLNERNSLKQQLQDHEKRFQDLSQRMNSQPAQPKVEDKLIQRLKGIDPEFGTWAEAQQKNQEELKALRDWRDQSERQRTQSEANAALDKLHVEYKVPEALRQMFRDSVRSKALDNPNLTARDLPSVYKEIHDNYSKFMESTRRQQTTQYVEGKKADAAVPAPSKGSTPRNAKGQFSYSNDPAEARSQIVANSMKILRSQ